jgi:hypothetical protein
VIRRAGSASPEEISADLTRSRASDTALSGNPTIANACCQCQFMLYFYGSSFGPAYGSTRAAHPDFQMVALKGLLLPS